MNLKKRVIWVGFFVFYQFFISFLINCGQDQPYNLLTDDEDAVASADATVAPCDCSGFLTEDCVDTCQDQLDEENSD